MENTQNKAAMDMELDDNFFDQDTIADQKAFQSQFEDPTPPASQTIPEGTKGPSGFVASEEYALEEEQKGAVEDFKFDDVMAQEEQQELDELNAKMGTDFKSRNELNEALKQVDVADKSSEISEEKRYVNYFTELLDKTKYPDDVLVREDKRIAAANANKNLNDQEVIDQIDYEVSQLTESGALSYAAQSIRDTLTRSRDEKANKIKAFEESKNLSAKEQADKQKRELQEGINDIFKEGSFLGVKPTKQDMLDVYKDISKNKHLEHLKAHPKDAVEFALFKKFRETIKKNLGKPNYETGVKNTLDELGMSNSSQTGTPGNDIANDSDAGDLTFLQRFAK
jgi:hypothetical protein